MPSPYRDYVPGQLRLPDVRKRLPEDHLAWTVDDLPQELWRHQALVVTFLTWRY